MDTCYYSEFATGSNSDSVPNGDIVNTTSPFAMTTGQRELLRMLPIRGDVIGLDDAIAVVAAAEPMARGQIGKLLSRGALALEFLDLPSVDREFVLRRL